MTWMRGGEDGSDLEFLCDFNAAEKRCPSVAVIYYSYIKGKYVTKDLLGREVYIDEGPILLPIGWKTDGNAHFCHLHKITFFNATIVNE